MQRVLARIPPEQKHHTVERVRLTLQEFMVEVMDALRAADPASVRFEDLLAGDAPTRERVVLAFLSILELAKIQALLIFQNVSDSGQPDGPVRVRLAVAGAALDAAAVAHAGGARGGGCGARRGGDRRGGRARGRGAGAGAGTRRGRRAWRTLSSTWRRSKR